MGDVKEITDNDFPAEVLQSTQPVLVDFWAPWCGPCRMIAPMVEQLAAENAAVCKVFKVNVDNNTTYATNYGVANIPTLILFKGGEVFKNFVGVQPKSLVQEYIDQAVA